MTSTIKDVARRAGVGVGTVSRVFNNSPLVSQPTRQRVVEAAAALQYHPDASARRLVQGRTHVIAFIERHSPFELIADFFMAEMLRGLHIAAREHGYHLLFEPSYPDTQSLERMLQLIRERHADGIILSGLRFDDTFLAQIRQEDLPIILHGRMTECPLPCIDIDNYAAAQAAVDHLISLGHTRIGMITNGPLVYIAAAERRAGYLAALERAHIPANEELVQFGSFSPESGYDAMQALLRLKPRPTAVFIASDAIALGAIQAVRESKLSIPQDLAMVGFDDLPLSAYISPALTTIRVPAQEIGYTAGMLLVERLAGTGTTQQETLLPSSLIIRDSCGAKAGRENPLN